MKRFLAILLPVLLLVGAMVFVPEASALTLQEGAEAARCDQCPKDLFGNTGAFKQVTNTVLYIVGIIAVMMLIFGGIKYVISGGDAKKVTDAKNTILYSIIGLVIAFLAFAIVNFVISALPSANDQEEETEETSLFVEDTES